MLIFDTETTIGPEQHLRFGTYQVRHREQEDRLVARGVFYDETLPETERQTLRDWVARENRQHISDTVPFEVLSREAFVVDVFYRYGHAGRGSIVGFNLPFDLSRIAIRHDKSTAKGMRGGFAFTLAEDGPLKTPHVNVKHLGGHKASIRFSAPRKPNTPSTRRAQKDLPAFAGAFIDVHVLAKAMLSQGFSLSALAQHLRVESPKGSGKHGETLTPEYVEYAMGDVQTTWECYVALAERYAEHGLDTPLHQIYSEASLGKAYLAKMKIKPWKMVQSEFSSEMLGYIAATYYGGRAEVHIRKVVTPTVYCDFKSMHPTVCANMNLWRFIIADGMDEEDATADVQAFLDSATAETMLQREVWQGLAVICSLRPSDDVFPVRAKYAPGAGANIGVNHLTSREPFWYTLADCVASKILTGKAPKIDVAIRFVPREKQDGLRCVTIAGKRGYNIDPTTEDFFRSVIDLRTDAKRAMQKACDSRESDELDAVQLNLKIIANATSYGVFAEVNAESEDDSRIATVNGPKGPFSVVTNTVEEDGKWFNPLLATCITSGARLMLAMAERFGQDEGLGWVFCDTDSWAFAPGDGEPGDASSLHDRAEKVRKRFNSLWPYDGKGDIMELESQNDPIEGIPPDLFCYAVSAKRYALFNRREDGTPVMRKVSSHGLGHLIPPYRDNAAPTCIPEPAIPLSQMGVGVRHWVYALWYRIVSAALAGESVTLADLPGMDGCVASQFSCATPSVLDWFATWNADKPYHQQVRPFGFMLSYSALDLYRWVEVLNPNGTLRKKSTFAWKTFADAVQSLGGLRVDTVGVRQWPKGLRLQVCRKTGKTPSELGGALKGEALKMLGRSTRAERAEPDYSERFCARVLHLWHERAAQKGERERQANDDGGRPPCPIAAYDEDAQKPVREARLVDRRTGTPVVDNTTAKVPRTVLVQACMEKYAEHLGKYHLRPEIKFIGGDGEGTLQRRHVLVDSLMWLRCIGKETNPYDTAGDSALLGETPKELSETPDYGSPTASAHGGENVAREDTTKTEAERRFEERQRDNRMRAGDSMKVREMLGTYGARKVARYAQVSVSELSRIANGKCGAPPKTMARILDALTRLEADRIAEHEEAASRTNAVRARLRKLSGFKMNDWGGEFLGMKPTNIAEACGIARGYVGIVCVFVTGERETLPPRTMKKVCDWLATLPEGETVEGATVPTGETGEGATVPKGETVIAVARETPQGRAMNTMVDRFAALLKGEAVEGAGNE